MQPNSAESFSYQYSYNTAGRVLKQRMFMQPGTTPNYATTSNTAATITDHAAVSFPVPSGLNYQAGQRVRAVADANDYMGSRRDGTGCCRPCADGLGLFLDRRTSRIDLMNALQFSVETFSN